MTCRRALGWAVALVCALSGNLAYADWLASRAAPDGSYSTSADPATPTQSTAEAVRTLRLLGRGSEVAAADAFLVAEAYHGTEYLARKIVSGVGAGNLDPSLVPELLSHQNTDGGFGEQSGYDSNPLDCAFALDALSASGNSTNPAVALAAGYLLQQQGADGSWLDATGTSNVYITALAARSLYAFRAQYSAIAPTVANAASLLISKRDSTGSWGQDFLTAQALLTLATVSSDVASIQQSATALTATQRADGSWSDDVYSTSVAMRALFVAGTRKGGSADTTGASLSGYVLSAQTNEPLPNATITLSGSSLSAQTNADGYFTIAGVAAGNYTVLASLPGFVSASAAATAYTGQSGSIGSIILAQATTAAVLRGIVFDATSQLPLSGVSVSLSGSSSYSATTGSDGSFELDGIAPGTYSVTFHASGHYDVNGSVTAPAGSVTGVRQGLSLQGSYQDNTAGTITGQLVDATTGRAVSGAAITLNGSASTTSGGDGGFSFASVARGNYQIQASAAGYAARTYSFVFAPGDSGNLGSLQLFAATGAAAPTSLTVIGTVVDGVSSHPLAGASISIAETGQTVTADATGAFTLSGLTSLGFDLTISAAGYQTRGFSGTASGFGQVTGSFALTPTGSGGTATASILRGTVADSVSQQPIGGALLAIAGTGLSVTTAADGSFEIDNIQPLSFTLSVGAAQYTSRTYPVSVTQPGTYALSVQLTPAANSGTNKFQIVSLSPVEGTSGANTVQHFAAQIVNLQASSQDAVVLGQLIDATGTVKATVSPYAPGTTTPVAQVPFAANGALDLVVPWNTAQFAPGAYRLSLQVVQPGTITKELPSGVVLTQAETNTTVTSTSSILGQVSFNPPLSQAGTSVAVALNALIINSGNVPLTGTGFTLTITDPTTGQALNSAQATAATIPVGNNSLLSFGSWVPTKAGNLAVSVTATNPGTQGTLTGNLYVGDKATGTFSVDKSVVPLGTQIVHASIAMQGVDVTTGTSTDPLFAAVKEAIRKGSLYVAPKAMEWKQIQNPQCLGCHIQTQSLLGLEGAQQKGAIDPQAAAGVAFLFNDITGSQQADGGLYASHYSYFDLMQTALGAWALSYWPDAKQVFPPLYKSSTLLLSMMSTSGSESWWNYTYCGDCLGWWSDNEAMNMTVVTAYSALLDKADQLNGSVPQTFRLQDAGAAGNTSMMGLQQGPDGSAWYVDHNGALYAYNISTGQTRTIATGLPNPSYGLAIRPDGTAYVASLGALTRIAPDGTRTAVVSGSTYGYMTDVAIGPDNLLYVVDHSNNCIWRISDSGSSTVFACGGLLTGPHGAVFDGSGNLLVTTNGSGNFRILSIAPSGTISIFADGLTFPPDWIRLGPDGYYYVSTAQYGSFQYTNPPGIYRVGPNGLVERIPIFNAPGVDGFNAIGVVGGSVYVDNPSDTHLYQLVSQPMDTSQLSAIAAALPGVARYSLNRYQDNNSYNVMHAWRIILLNEIRKHTQDTALIQQIDAATASIAAILRQRQRPDGGWPYSTDLPASDPTATCFVGMALQYTHPSTNDPAVRNAITYLLNSQQADGSWPSNSQAFHRSLLGPASFVMAYLPQALELLGGIDTGLNLTLPASVQLSNPSLAPTAQTAGTDGSTTYLWSQQGVTSQGRSVSFDLTLANMGYQEDRPVASSAYLGFANSFTGEQLRSDLAIPHVRAVSALAISVASDQASYPANTPVAVTSTINNVGPSVISGQVHVVIRASDGTLVADLGTSPFGSLATGASTAFASSWNSGTLLAGTYQVDAQLYDASGALVDERTAGFNIVAPTAAVIAAVSPDKTSYKAWDTVTLTSQIRNVSANAIQAPAAATLIVQTPSGAQLYSGHFPVNSLAPGALLDVPSTVHISDAVTGDYPVRLVLNDAFTNAVVATAASTFHVNRVDIQALTGKVSVQSPTVYQGDTNLCSETVTNLSGTALAGVALTRTIVSLDTQAVIQTTNISVGFGAQQQQGFLDSVATRSLPLGAYACVISASLNGSTQQLGAAGFQVLQPPIRINASLGVGTRGRLLVLMDGEDEPPCGRIRDLELWAPFHTPLPNDARVDVELTDAAGDRVDIESVTLAGYQGTVNRSSGLGADLSITAISRDVLSVKIHSDQDLKVGYRIVATVHSASLPRATLGTGIMGSAAGWPVTSGARFGDFTSFDVRPIGASSQAYHQQAVPSTATQRAFLEQQLTDAGWSYKVVTAEEDFEHELRSGAYNEYALFARREKLDEHARSELREAVFRGEGLLYATRDLGEEDEGVSSLGDALGITHRGELSDVTGVNLFTPTLKATGIAPFALDEDVERVDLKGAQMVGRFEGTRSATNPAVTSYVYGQGASVYVDYELLAEATRQGSGSLHAALLENALEYVQPNVAQPHAAEVIPLHVALTNQGVATPGQIQLALPAGVTLVDPGTAQVTGNTLTWTFNLAVSQQLGFDAWVRLPAVSGAVAFDADVQTGTTGSFVDYSHAVFRVSASALATLADARALAQADRSLERVRYWLDVAQWWLDRNRKEFALLSLLAATDELGRCSAAQATELRLDVDQVIWSLSRSL